MQPFITTSRIAHRYENYNIHLYTHIDLRATVHCPHAMPSISAAPLDRLRRTFDGKNIYEDLALR